MRTTLTIADPLYRQAKAEAARRGATVGSVIESALRAYLEGAQAPVPELAPLTRSAASFRPGIDLDDMSSVWEMLDESGPFRDRGGDARR